MQKTTIKIFLIFFIFILFFDANAGIQNNDKGLKRIVITANDGIKIADYKRSYALLIGVSNYSNGWPVLDSIPREISEVENSLMKQGFDVTKVLDPNSKKLETSFKEFIDSYGYDKNNRLLFFFSGHGHTRHNTKGYIVPTDAPDPNIDEKGFLQKSIGMSQILTWARQIEAKHALFLFDSCFSGTIFKAKSLPKIPPHITQLTILPVRQFITAGSAGQTVPAKSTFTPVFIDAINYGLGDLDNDGYITGTELGLYLRNKVPEHSQQNPQFGKIQDYELSRGDFVFQIPKDKKVNQLSVPLDKELYMALVIGNGAYKQMPLPGAVDDARKIALSLQNHGYQVNVKINLSLTAMKQVVNDFVDKLKKSGSTGLFYYSGFGKHKSDKNYLLPVNYDHAATSVSIQWILNLFGNAGNKGNIVILDTMFYNEPKLNYIKEYDKFYSNTPLFLAYATQPGGSASERKGSGFFTKNILHAIGIKRKMSLLKLFKNIRVAVKLETKGAQIPWISSSFNDEVYLINTQGAQ